MCPPLFMPEEVDIMRSKYAISGITWDDVEVALAELEKQWTAVARYTITRQQEALGLPMGLKVTLELTGYQKSGSLGFTRRVSASWPTYAQKTMPGLLLYLAHALNESLLADAPKYRRQGKTQVYLPG